MSTITDNRNVTIACFAVSREDCLIMQLILLFQKVVHLKLLLEVVEIYVIRVLVIVAINDRLIVIIHLLASFRILITKSDFNHDTFLGFLAVLHLLLIGVGYFRLGCRRFETKSSESFISADDGLVLLLFSLHENGYFLIWHTH